MVFVCLCLIIAVLCFVLIWKVCHKRDMQRLRLTFAPRVDSLIDDLSLSTCTVKVLPVISQDYITRLESRYDKLNDEMLRYICYADKHDDTYDASQVASMVYRLTFAHMDFYNALGIDTYNEEGDNENE